MLKHTKLQSVTFAHISLTLVGVMWVFPFLLFNHAYPITTFYQEFSAAVLALCALPLLLKKNLWQADSIPYIAFLPIGLMLLLLLQYSAGLIGYADQMWLFMLYFLLAALLILLGRQLGSELGLPLVATTLAVFLVVGTELNALAGILQHFHWRTFLSSVVTVKTSVAVYGNLAQPNHYANYLTLGLISIGLLHYRYTFRFWKTALLVLPLLFVIVLSGSRSSWLYQFFIVGMSFVWQRRDASYRPLFRYSLLVFFAFALMHGIVQLPGIAADNSTSTVARLLEAGQAESGSIRFYLWREAVLIFSHHPLLGAGFGQYAWQHFTLGPQWADPNISGLYNNTHNLVLQLAAETGLIGLAIFLGTVGLWLAQACSKTPRTVYHWWSYGLLVVLLIHSLLEYPLWYAYFIGIAAFLLGLTDRNAYRLALPPLGRLSVALLLMFSIVSLTQLYQGYQKLAYALSVRPTSALDTAYPQRARSALLAAQNSPLLRPYSELFLTSFIIPSRESLGEKLALNQRAMYFVPIASVVYRQAWLLALDGQTEAAKQQLDRAIWSYPLNHAEARAELTQLARKNPDHFSALLEFATQKFEEYPRGVSK